VPRSESGDSDDLPSDSKLEAGTPKVGTHELPKEEKKPSLLERQIERLNKYPLEEGEWYLPRNLRIIVKYRAVPFVIKALTYGTSVDIHHAQTGTAGTREGDRMREVFAAATIFPNEVEHSYSFIQVLTACTASFAHGANDISNAVGPWAVIYGSWHSGIVQGKSSNVPVWMLAVAAVALVLGLATYGYNIIKVLGNKITYHSPSRGASMEMVSIYHCASENTSKLTSMISRLRQSPSFWLRNMVFLSQRQCASPVLPSELDSAKAISRL
jgi:sodium-dependent phosphate transporter